jgi:hypothetical protein
MTNPSNHKDHAEHLPQLVRGPGRRGSLPVKRAVATIAASLGLAALAAGCGGSNHTRASSDSSHGLLAQYFAQSRCMRSHGVPNFPDPTTSGGIGIILPPGFNTNSPAFLAAQQACQALGPTAHPVASSPDKVAAEVKVARCMRSHGLPNFPDPNGQGVLDRSKFDEGSAAFKSAANACKSVITAAGPLDIRR